MIRARRWWRVLLVLALLGVWFVLWGPRPALLPLATSVDGADPAHARGVIVFLHGRGGGIARIRPVVSQLREAGLPADYAIVLVEAPYTTGFGHQWGDDAAAQAKSRARLQARLTELLGSSGPPQGRLIIAGFSQGAGMAIDTAVSEPRISALASFSPCWSALRGDLPKREGLRVLLAHGTHDAICPIEESRSLAHVLQAANKDVNHIEFDGGHSIPPEALRALVVLATAP